MTYDRLARRYDGSVQVGKMDAKYQDFRDVAARGDLQFSLWHDQAEIKSLKLASEGSSLQLSGKIADFENPQVRLTYGSTIDVAQMGAITRAYQLRGGTIVSTDRAATPKLPAMRRLGASHFVTSTIWMAPLPCGRPP